MNERLTQDTILSHLGEGIGEGDRARLLVGAACMLLSGAAALGAEVVWARMLREVFGSSVEAVSTVLGVFFAGLALGAVLASRRAPGALRPARAYALLEVAIAVALLLTLPGISYLADRVPAWEATTGSPWLWRLLRATLAGALLLPATTAMGATFPFMVRILGGRVRDGRLIGLLYASNTFGGVAGALVAGFVAIGALGCRASIGSAATLNLAAAAAALLWLREVAAAPRPSTPPAARPIDGAPGAGVLVAAAMAGAAALGAEVAWTRAMVFGFGTSTYAFASVLVAVLLAIGAGGALFAWLPEPRRLESALGVVLVAEGVLIALSSLAFSRLDLLTLHGAAIAMADVLPRPLTWPLLWIGVALAVAGPATLLSGYAFPLAAHARAVQVGSAARGAGQVSAANTAGTIAGSLAAGFWLLPALGPRGTLTAVAAAVAAAGAALLGRAPAARAAAAAAAGLALWLAAAWLPAAADLRADIERPEDRVLYAAEGAQASVRVFEQTAGNQTLRRLAIDGQTIASNGMGDLMVKEIALAHLPFLLHPAPRRVALVGLGTGITLGAIASHEVVREMVCAEIVPEVWEAARLFAADNGGVLDDPRLTAIAGDGVHYLRGTTRVFDAIVGDEKVSLHAAANGTFFSREYYALVKERLAAGGVFVQWVPLILPPEDQATVMRGFASVFADGIFMTIGRFGFIQVGGAPTPSLDVDRAARLLADPGVRRALAFPAIDLTDALFVAAAALGRAADVERLAGAGSVHTVDHPVLDYGIARWDFRYETYRERAARSLQTFIELAGAAPSPWLAGAGDEGRRARTAVSALLRAHRHEVLGDRQGALEALAAVDGPQGLAALHPFAERYRFLLRGGR